MRKAVIFDIGGVLAHDVWEHLLLDDEEGVATKYGLPKQAVEEVGQDLWLQYETISGDPSTLEKEYWNKFIAAFPKQLEGRVTAQDLIDMTDHFVRPVKGIFTMLDVLKSEGVVLAICSNNNDFWFERQWNKLGLNNYFDEHLVFLSCRTGCIKAGPQMFRIVLDGLRKAGIDDAADCVFLDDRPRNVAWAAVFGIQGVVFS